MVAFLLGGLAIVILGALNGVHRGRYQVGSFDELIVVGQTFLVSGSIVLIVNQLFEPRLVPLSATLGAPFVGLVLGLMPRLILRSRRDRAMSPMRTHV